MGYIRHDAVIAVTGDWTDIGGRDETGAVAAFRDSMPDEYRRFLVGPVRGHNGDDMWCFLPDGSKEGWPDSDAVERWRTAFRNVIDASRRHEYVGISFGGDLDGAYITHDGHNESAMRAH